MSTKRTDRGYFDDLEIMALAAYRLSQPKRSHNVYMTVNPVQPELLARCANRIEEWAERATADQHIARRVWILIDLDPERIADISATDEEHALALERAAVVTEWLVERGIPRNSMVLGDSGNGAYILIRVNLPNDEESGHLVSRFLVALGLYLSDEQVKVDTSTGNASRLCKVFGTVARKGDDVPLRPHRRARLIDAPGDIVIADPPQLWGVASLVPDPTLSRGSERRSNTFDLDSFLRQFEGNVSKDEQRDYGRLIVLERCPYNSDHVRTARIVQLTNGALGFGCFHTSCQGKDWERFRADFAPIPVPARTNVDLSVSAFNGHAKTPTDNRSPGGHTKRAGAPTSGEESASPPAPPVLAGAAYQGIVGKIVRALEQQVEPSAAGILFHLLAYFGWTIGRGREVRLGEDRHGVNEFFCFVGETARGRKGMLANIADAVLGAALPPEDAHWLSDQQASGLGSGEGLIAAVRDRIEKEGEDGEVKVVDPGVEDKRVLFLETEFAMILRAMTGRDGNTISARMREAWDGRDLRNTVKGSPLRATAPHISFVAHITKVELQRLMTLTEYANGFGNRFLWVYTTRDRHIARPKRIAWGEPPWPSLIKSVRAALEWAAEKPGVVTDWSDSAGILYDEIYPTLDDEGDDLPGMLLARGPAHVVRLALLYATLDRSREIQEEHLRAALACWQYCVDSIRYYFHPDSLRQIDMESSKQGNDFRPPLVKEALSYGLGLLLAQVSGGGASWSGTAEELDTAVRKTTTQGDIPRADAEKLRHWPADLRWLGRRLTAHRDALRQDGIVVDGPASKMGSHIWTIRGVPAKSLPCLLDCTDEREYSLEPGTPSSWVGDACPDCGLVPCRCGRDRSANGAASELTDGESELDARDREDLEWFLAQQAALGR